MEHNSCFSHSSSNPTDPNTASSSSLSEILQTADVLQTDNASSIITIGMELEFLIVKASHSPSLPPKPPILEAIGTSLRNFFRSGGISIQTEIFPQRPNDHPDQSKFQIMEEKSCDPFLLDKATGERIPCEAVEICTPIMRFRSWEWVIPTIFEYLTGQFDCRFNPTTGLHVHVGRGCGWDLRTAKSIAKAVIVFESTLDHYHPPHRRPMGNWCISSNRHNDNLKHSPKSVIMKRLERVRTVRELINLISPHKFFKYNFNSLGRYGTVEFRQADAGIGIDRAVQWINLIVRFVTAAVETAPEEFELWAEDEDPAVCCPPQVFDRFGVPWVGVREQVSHISKVETVAVDAWTGFKVDVRVGKGTDPPKATREKNTQKSIEEASLHPISHAN